MERAIDRSSYRRSARNNDRILEKEKTIELTTNKKNYTFLNIFLNQTIISLLIIILILTANYYEMTNVTDWLSKNLSDGYGAMELASKIKNKILVSSGNEDLLIKNNSGENQIPSGENHLEAKKIYSGEFITAVEGINQMADDARIIKERYDFFIPLNGTITSQFGTRVSDNPIVSSYHTGLDIAANTGTLIYSAHSGKVIMAKQYSSYGNCIMIENEKLITVYAHCSSILVKEGDIISKGTEIAKVGMTGNATGPHLHFEIRYEDRFVDPEKVLDF